MIAQHEVKEKMIEYFLLHSKGDDIFKKDVLEFCKLSSLPKNSNVRKRFNSHWKFFTTQRNGAFLIRNYEVKNAWFYLE